MINKKKLQDQIKEILSSNKNLNTEDFENFIKLFDSKEGNEVKKTITCDNLIKKLFGVAYGEPLVPWGFFNTELGKAILEMKYGFHNTEIYFVKEIAKMLGKSVQYISQEIKAGRLKAYQRGGRNNVVYRQDLVAYINSRKDLQEKKINYDVLPEEFIIPKKERDVKYD